MIERIKIVRAIVEETWDCDNCFQTMPSNWCDYHEDIFQEAMDNLWMVMENKWKAEVGTCPV